MSHKTAYIALMMMFLLSAFRVGAQVPNEWEGKWWLGIISEASLPLNLTFAREGADSSGLRPLIYSPTQSEKAIEPLTWTYRNDTLKMEVKSIGFKTTLRYRADSGNFEGTLRQNLLRTSITLEPSAGIYRINRPQEPREPYAYTEECLVLKHKDKYGDRIEVGVTITYPKGDGKYPCVILISGSGQQNRDEEVFGHKPFKLIADYLTRNGVATLRYDDRGVGESSGSLSKMTTYTQADDAEWLFKWLKKHPKIDRKRIGIIGHSEGGMIGPMIAARNKDVAFVVMLAGPGCSGAEILRQQIVAMLRASGVEDEKLIDARDKWQKICLESTFTHSPEQYDSIFKAAAKLLTKDMTNAERRAIGMTQYDAIVMAQQMQSEWFRTFVKIDPKDYLTKLRCPVLAINGEKDLQVLADENLEAIAQYVRPSLLTERKFENLNHLFQHCKKGLPSEYMLIEETMSEEVLVYLSQWVKATSKKIH